MIFDFIRRKLRAKGHGIHSPFAFHFVTRVFSEKSRFYAFDDIAALLEEHRVACRADRELCHLSYRIVREYKPGAILEVHSGEGVNTLYIASANKSSSCCCIETDADKISRASRLLSRMGCNVLFSGEVDLSARYDALFLNISDKTVDVETLFRISAEECFWVINPIRTGYGRSIWRQIANDARATVTFDAKDTGIVFLKKGFNKLNYFI